MCELRDPNGTIWDFARDLQKENDKLQSQLTTLMPVADAVAKRLYDWQVSELWEQVDEDALTAYNQWRKENEHTYGKNKMQILPKSEFLSIPI